MFVFRQLFDTPEESAVQSHSRRRESGEAGVWFVFVDQGWLDEECLSSALAQVERDALSAEQTTYEFISRVCVCVVIRLRQCETVQRGRDVRAL